MPNPTPTTVRSRSTRATRAPIASCASLLLLLVPWAAAAPQQAEDDGRFASATVRELVGDALADVDQGTGWTPLRQVVRPRVVLDPGVEAEAFLFFPDDPEAWSGWDLEAAEVRVRAAQAGPVSGRILVPPRLRPDGSPEEGAEGRALRFALEVPDEPAGEHERRAFWVAAERHHDALLARGVSGAAWFRHLRDEARAAAGEAVAGPDEGVEARAAGPGEVEDLYELYTGGRALSENLQLDRALAIGPSGAEAGVPLADLAGVEVEPFDWTELIGELDPEHDRFAARVPEDQHAVFFPSLGALVALLDELEEEGGPLLAALEGSAEHAGTAARYQRQLCLSLDDWARLLGPALVGEVALTGSDPYLRTGSDVAVWLEARDVAALRAVLERRHAAALERVPAARRLEGRLGDHAWWGVADADRRVSSYAVTLDDALLVSNSLAQLGRVLEVEDGTRPALAATPEYTFFRDRYPRGAEGESALLVVSDAALRRWTGPRLRIGAARRTRAAAWLAELQARELERVVARLDEPGAGDESLEHGDAPEELGALALGPAGVRSDRYGNLEFLTPILELDLERVTEQEATAYGRFRDGYQRNWSEWFDPIAIRLELAPGRVAADLSVFPLILGSDYRELIELTGDARLAPSALDPHGGTLAHLALALDTGGEGFRRLVGDAGGGVAGALGPDPLGWIGGGVAFYADQDPFWDELADALERDDRGFLEDQVWRLPVALHVEVDDQLRLAGFLATVRGMADGVAPGLTRWETRHHGERAYVRIGATREALPPELADAAVYYAALPDALIVTVREDLLLRALDRRGPPGGEAGTEQPTGPQAAADSGPSSAPWPGESAALRVDRGALVLATAASGGWERARAAQQAWSHAPVLDAWRRRFPDRDPGALHEAVWKVRLCSPGGGEYVWDQTWGTHVSTVWGHPGAPGPGPEGGALGLWPLAGFSRGDFGLTFEHQGLRARVLLER